MARWGDNDVRDDDGDPEDPSPSEQDGPEDEEADGFGTVPCPFCGKPMSDLAENCPHCKNFVTREDVTSNRKPTWVVVVTVLLLIALTIGAVSFR